MLYETGYYLVNNKKYVNKIEAVLEAQKTLTEVSWWYHNDIFDRVNWLQEPETTLDTFYKMRAQQIRNKYDYIIIMCSGGADSTNVVKTFLNNNIHVDEVIGGGPMSGLRNWNWNDKDCSVNNTISETKYALLPLMDEIAKKFPKTKVTFNDYFEQIVDYKTDEWLYKCQDWINPVVNAKGRLDKFPHIVKLAEQGKRIGVVWGIDKPVVTYKQNGDLYTKIGDLGVNVADAPFDQDYPNVDRVLFYWTPDMPEMLVKQSHVVAKYVHMKENLWIADTMKKLLDPKYWPTPTNPNPNDFKGEYQRGIVPAIYPTTYDTVFQCQKSRASFMPLQHDWFYTLHKDTRIHQMIDSDFKLFYKSIHPKYLKPTGNGFQMFSLGYKIGHYTQFL
jgi:hypothetical protein